MFDDTKETRKSRLQGEVALVFKFGQNLLFLAPEFGLSRSETSDQLSGNSAFVALVSSAGILEQRLTASTGFRFPSLEERYIDSGLVRSNTKLKTEKSSAVSWTCSLKWQALRVHLTLFTRKNRDLIRYVVLPGFRSQAQNFAKTENTGVNFQGKWDAHKYLSLATTLGFDRHTNAKKDSKTYQRKIPKFPSLRGFSKLDIGSTEYLAVSLSFLFEKERYLDEANELPISDYESWDLGFSRQITELGSQLTFAVRNLFDTQNFDNTAQALDKRSYYLELSQAFL